jgi:hypothetical protein
VLAYGNLTARFHRLMGPRRVSRKLREVTVLRRFLQKQAARSNFQTCPMVRLVRMVPPKLGLQQGVRDQKGQGEEGLEGPHRSTFDNAC